MAESAVARLSVGGIELCFSLPGALALSASHYGAFLTSGKSATSTSQRIEIEVIAAEPPVEAFARWQPSHLLMDSASTWALGRATLGSWRYHFGPSPTQTSDPPVFHLFTDETFSRGALYVGDRTGRETIESGELYPLDEVLVRHWLAYHGGLHLHAAGVEIEHKGYLFLGDSGAGKSTIAGFFEDELGGERVYSDDRIIVRDHGGQWLMHGSPWHGTLARIKPASLPLGGFCFIEQDSVHRVKRLSRSEALAKLAQVYLAVWWVPELRLNQLAAMEQLVRDSGAAFFTLSFALDAGIVSFFREELKS